MADSVIVRKLAAKWEAGMIEDGLIAHSIFYFSIAALTKVCTRIVIAQEDKALME